MLNGTNVEVKDSGERLNYYYSGHGAILNIDKKNDPNNILEKNPFRYRGYYYDNETDLLVPVTNVQGD